MKPFRSVWLQLLLTAATTALTARANAPDLGRSAQVGTVDYLDGSVTLDGRQLAPSSGKLAVLADGQLLSSAAGHAEILLTPGVYLRTGKGAEAVLENNSLSDTRVRLLSGSAILEVDQIHKENLIRLDAGRNTVRILKTGLCRLDASPFLFTVLKGKAEVSNSQDTRRLGAHRQASDEGRILVSKVRASDTDDLARWSRLRSEYESEASIASAQYFYDMGWGWSGLGWFWNPWFSTYSWFPAGGWYLNPYGFSLWSPYDVYWNYPIRYYGFRGVRYAPRAGYSPSGPNLQRGYRSGQRPLSAGAGRLSGVPSRTFTPEPFRGRGLASPSFSPGAFSRGSFSRGSFGGGGRAFGGGRGR